MSEIKFSSKYMKSAGNLNQLPNIKQLELLKYTFEQKISVRMKVYGNSMSPFLRNGDVILLSPIENNPPKIGDILAFEQSGIQKLVIHRIISVGTSGFLMKGDNYHQSDGVILSSQLLGRVINIERDNKNANLGISRAKGLLAWFSKMDLLRRFHILLHLPVNFSINFLGKLFSIPFLQGMMVRRMPTLEIVETDHEEFSKLSLLSVHSYKLLVPDQHQLETGCLIARNEAGVFGYCQVGMFPQANLPEVQLWVTSLGFNPLYQASIFPEKLLIHMLKMAKGMKAERIYLGLNRGNEPAIQLLQKLGFSFISEIENLDLRKNGNIPISDPFIIMKKEISRKDLKG